VVDTKLALQDGLNQGWLRSTPNGELFVAERQGSPRCTHRDTRAQWHQAAANALLPQFLSNLQYVGLAFGETHRTVNIAEGLHQLNQQSHCQGTSSGAGKETRERASKVERMFMRRRQPIYLSEAVRKDNPEKYLEQIREEMEFLSAAGGAPLSHLSLAALKCVETARTGRTNLVPDVVRIASHSIDALPTWTDASLRIRFVTSLATIVDGWPDLKRQWPAHLATRLDQLNQEAADFMRAQDGAYDSAPAANWVFDTANREPSHAKAARTLASSIRTTPRFYNAWFPFLGAVALAREQGDMLPDVDGLALQLIQQLQHREGLRRQVPHAGTELREAQSPFHAALAPWKAPRLARGIERITALLRQ
jgi:hypothetical protein